MKTCIHFALLLKAKSGLSYSILLVLSVSVIASMGLSEALNKGASPSKNSQPINSLEATISLGAGVFPWSVVVSPNSQTIYVACTAYPNGNFVAVIDSQTDTITATIPLAGDLSDLGITPDGSTLY
jgi:DNA-binding beta-propeller fold protein YncE